MLCKCDQSGPKETLRSSYYFVGLRWQTFGRVQNTCSHNYPQYLAAGPLWLLSCESNLQHTSVNISEQTYLLHGSEFLSKSVIIFTTESCGSSVPQRLIKDLTSLYIDVKTRFFVVSFWIYFYITELLHLVLFLFLLLTGDRIVKVNGESIIGKTYSQVIALIQNR